MIPRSARPFDASVLEAVDGWGASTVAIAVVDTDGLIASRGPPDVALPWASLTKLVTACAVLVGVSRGILALDDAAGPTGATVRHLLAHAGGNGFDGGVLAPPGRMRIYSNRGFDRLGPALETAAGRPFAELLDDWVLAPLSMGATRLVGRPSEGLAGPATDLVALAWELVAPRVLPPGLVAEASAVAFPGLRGVLPGFGLQDPCDWGLGFEIRDGKTPHWTGSGNSPATFGHFGRSGTFLWVDPDAGLALACLTDRAFGAWAGEAWPAISDAVLAAAG
ncbi:MAG TPA: serine hydrolase domain-containing protein [Candidatus Limnocylindrales bacterium]|nr:serine hydrolase domain-containing protein [Candidatus Limnocylindrales bacterium]